MWMRTGVAGQVGTQLKGLWLEGRGGRASAKPTCHISDAYRDEWRRSVSGINVWTDRESCLKWNPSLAHGLLEHKHPTSGPQCEAFVGGDLPHIWVLWVEEGPRVGSRGNSERPESPCLQEGLWGLAGLPGPRWAHTCTKSSPLPGEASLTPSHHVLTSFYCQWLLPAEVAHG